MTKTANKQFLIFFQRVTILTLTFFSEQGHSSSCVDRNESFLLPNNIRTDCKKAASNTNNVCNVNIVQENCPNLCKMCPCADTIDGEVCCKDQEGEIPFNQNLILNATCKSFIKESKYCNWSRIQKSCPKTCMSDTCNENVLLNYQTDSLAKCEDQIENFSLPDDTITSCTNAGKEDNINSSCNVKVVEEKCPKTCKVCPLCKDTNAKVWMGNQNQFCSYVRSQKDICDRFLWLKDECPISCGSCCLDQVGEIPFNQKNP